MTDVIRVNGDVRITGDLTVDGNMPQLSRSDLAKESNVAFPVPMTAWRVHDALHTLLPGTPAGDDLGLVGDFGVDAPRLSAGDLKAAGATTRYARSCVALPPEYIDGDSVAIRVSAGMADNVADNTATVDLEAHKLDGEGGVGADICATAAQSINSTTFSDYDFTITPTGLSAGDELDLRLAVAVNDAASTDPITAIVASVRTLCDIRG